MEPRVLLVAKEDRIATLTLNRPQAMNALSTELRAALVDAFDRLAEDPDAGVVILTGAGRAFCAGLDLKELSSGGVSAAAAIGDTDVVGAMERFPKPVIGAINGFAITGGFEVALACDVLIASTEARFADTHARVGIMPGWGLSQKLSRSIGIWRAKELSLTGNYLDAATAAAWGLVNRVVPAEQLLPTCRALAADMLSCDPEVMLAYKKLIDDGFRLPYGQARQLESERSREHVRSLTPEKIAARRAAVQQRGREQAGGH